MDSDTIYALVVTFTSLCSTSSYGGFWMPYRQGAPVAAPLKDYSNEFGEVPNVIVSLAAEIERKGDTVGIYRMPGNIADVRKVTRALVRNPKMALGGYDVSVLCSAMKRFFLELVSDELIPWNPTMLGMLGIYKTTFKESLAPGAPESFEIMTTIHEMSLVRRHTVAFLLLHLRTILHEQMEVPEEVRMRPRSLALVTSSFWTNTPTETEKISALGNMMTAMLRGWNPEFICTAKTQYSQVLADKCSGSALVPIREGFTMDYEQRLIQYQRKHKKMV